MTKTDPFRRLRIAPLLLALAGCSTLAATPRTAPLSNGRTMTSTASTAPSGADTTQDARTLVQRMLAYLDSLHKPADASLQRFVDLMGPDAGRAEYGDYAELMTEVGDGWMLSVSASERASPVLRYMVSHDNLNSDALDVDMTPVCGMDLSAIRNVLLASGFTAEPALPPQPGYERAGAMTHVFTRGALFVELLAQRRKTAEPQEGAQCIHVLEADFVRTAAGDR